eukprot:scaffold26088_cov132-Cylindrotheca_fusiformis.AAC.9
MFQKDASSSSKGRKYWLDQVDPELSSIMLRMCPTLNFNSKLKIAIFRAMMKIPGPTGKGVSSFRIKGIGRMYFPKEKGAMPPTTTTTSSETKNRAVLYIHGGGRIMGCSSGATESKMCSKIVQLFQVPVLSVSYKLAPNHPFPAGLDDILNAYSWLVEYILNGDDTTAGSPRILVVGESAGGGLAAELCQRLVDMHRSDTTNKPKLPVPVAQLLFYPMMDDRTSMPDHVDSSIPPNLVWNHTSNRYAWGAYLKKRRGKSELVVEAELPDYAVAARRKDMTGLPAAWIAVGDLDLLCRESREYIQRLRNARVHTKYEEVKGGYHGMVTMCSEDARPIAHLWDSFRTFGREYLRDGV